MKKYLYSLLMAVTGLTLAACSADEGQEVGNDSAPAVTVYGYAPEAPYSADNDVTVRFVTNNKTQEVYYLPVKTADEDIDAKLAAGATQQYIDRVMSEGKKVEGLGANANAEVTVTDLYGTYTIFAVAIDAAGHKALGKQKFVGIEWEENGIKGTYQFGSGHGLGKYLGMTAAPTVLQKATNDAAGTLYRFKDVFGSGHSLKIRLLPDYVGYDADGKYTFFRVTAQNTGIQFGSNGDVWIRDVGYWQGNDAFVLSSGYESGMYADGYCFIFAQYYCEGGNMGYNYDYFVPGE